MSVGQTKRFTERYIESLFLVWYQNDRPSFPDLIQVLDPDDNGRKPQPTSIQKWSKKYDWRKRADELDRQVAMQLNAKAVTEKVEMVRRHKDAARKLQSMALDYLVTEGMGTANAAIRAWIEAVRVETESIGIDQLIKQAQEMDDDEVQHRIAELLEQVESEANRQSES